MKKLHEFLITTLSFQAKFCTEFFNRTYAELLKCKFHTLRKYENWRNGRGWQAPMTISEVIIAGGEDEVNIF